ncbi:MAG: hypothetical protein CL864_00640 [Cyanobium sp. SAT1300]|nr:hypothetical protein [Cyanobium sp. SAT1300]
MKLLRLQRELIWPEHVSTVELRAWLRSEFADDPDVELLRWAITGLTTAADGARCLQVEGVRFG